MRKQLWKGGGNEDGRWHGWGLMVAGCGGAYGHKHMVGTRGHGRHMDMDIIGIRLHECMGLGWTGVLNHMHGCIGAGWT